MSRKTSEKDHLTAFVLTGGDEVATVSTSDPTWATSLQRLAKERPEDCKLQKAIEGLSVYEIPADWICLNIHLDNEADRRHRAADRAAREAYFAALAVCPEDRGEYFDGLVFSEGEPAATDPPTEEDQRRRDAYTAARIAYYMTLCPDLAAKAEPPVDPAPAAPEGAAAEPPTGEDH